MGTRVSYQHSKKAGNKGDVWKHFILLECVDRLLRENDDRSCTFEYWETHCGEGSYTLGPKGEWRSGIGKFLPAKGSLANHPYFRLLGAPLCPNSVYPGSWRLVGMYLENRKIPFKMYLFDISEDVANTISSDQKEDRIWPTVMFRQEEGFSALQFCGNPDLLFIDPPYKARTDWRRCKLAGLELNKKDTPFLIWYPVFWDTEPDRLVKEVQSPGYEVIWASMGPKPSQNLKGCGMLAGGAMGRVLEESRCQLRELAQALGGELSVRLAGKTLRNGSVACAAGSPGLRVLGGG
jgi:23S rRNA (adenine2030-N6)-methyltransferase